MEMRIESGLFSLFVPAINPTCFKQIAALHSFPFHSYSCTFIDFMCVCVFFFSHFLHFCCFYELELALAYKHTFDDKAKWK